MIMFKIEIFNLNLYPTQGINSISWSLSLPGANGFFVLCGVCYFLKGVFHSSSLPDYIEDKKNGGQKTDWSDNTSLCNVTTNIIGREAQKDRMLKTVNKSQLIGTL